MNQHFQDLCATKEHPVVKRQIDEMGRVLLPADYLEWAGLAKKESVGILFDGQTQTIRLGRWEDSCVFCHSTHQLKNLDGVYACSSCIAKWAQM